MNPIPKIVASISDTEVDPINLSKLNDADIIELRVDLFEDKTEVHIKETFAKAQSLFQKPIIGTVRDPSEGGAFRFDDRLQIYKLIAEHCQYIDIEIASEDLIREFAKDCNHMPSLKIIGSYHNFDQTPDEQGLETILERSTNLPIDITKIAVMAKDYDDLIKALHFANKNRHRQIIVISMGTIGLPSRVIGGLFGSLMTYGYITSNTAPGQMHISELRTLLKRLFKPNLSIGFY